ncbi:MAG TPA: sigma-70 family RNA polymerase sigma factor [Vicinamibacterales bacterium]|nr:sigma-70 family RNA polymerase sigma factor [Vicinamibacterales bacterium]
MSGRPIEVDQRTSARTGDATATPASVLAADIKALVLAGEREAARDRFGGLVALLQRRALRIAYHYLRDAADADEAAQDAFVKVFLHIEQYREELSFDVWFMRILVNACLDRLKSRSRQQRWIATPLDDGHDERPVEQAAGTAPSTEHVLLARERWQQVLEAVATLPDRQRLVFTLSHLDERTAGEISEATGMSPATVRVHLFRAIRKLRGILGEQP